MSDTPALQRLFAELKRRHVFRVMAVYGVVGFVVLQVVDLLVPALLLPEWTYRLVAVLLLIGFPVAVILAWAFELTPEGVQRSRPASGDEIRRAVEAPAANRWPVGLAALAGVILLGVGAWWVLRPPDAAAERTYDSIAVLPFTNLTGDEEAEYLGDGMAEELLNALTRIEGLKVASRTGSFAFKDAAIDPTTIGDSLGVALVLEGSVRAAGDRLRITAQLIDAEDGYHVWSERYDRPRSDLLDLQEDLTGLIVDALAVQLDTGGVAEVADRGTRDPAAYDLYLQGRHFWNKRRTADMDVAIGLFREAIEIDSSYAAAYAAIAETYAVPVAWDLRGPEFALDEAERYARLALGIDPTLAQAHTALAYVYTMRDLDFRRAEDSFARAIELEPGYATAHQWFAELLSAQDRHDEAVVEVRKAESLDPTPIIVWNVARVLNFAGRYEETIAQLGGIDGVVGGRGRGVGTVMEALYELEDFERMADLMEAGAPPEARPAVEPLIATLRTAPIDEKRRAVIGMVEDFSESEATDGRPADLGLVWLPARYWVPVEPDTAIVRLERMVRDSVTVKARIEWFHVLADPAFDPIRRDPRYVELDARIRR